jgi:hypothetical protein
MGKRRKKKKVSSSTKDDVGKALIEYHQIPFALFHKELKAQGYNSSDNHQIARSFWNVVPPGAYDPFEAKPLLETYSEVLEREIKVSLSRHSIAYWLHSYRRLFPGGTGDNPKSQTILIVRGTLEAAVQKYAKSEVCSGVGFSKDLAVKDIFNGILMHPKLETLGEHLRLHNQLVLTDFDVHALRELYELEKLAYQIWRVGATLRIVGKGAGLIVDPSHPGGFYDSRSNELDELVQRYDSRLRGFSASSTGTSFNGSPGANTKGTIFLGKYNVEAIEVSHFARFFDRFGLKLTNDFPTNFIWAPFNMGRYCKAHLPFSAAFRDRHGVALEWLFATVGALLWRIFVLWREDPYAILRHFQRAYEGPYLREYIEREIRYFLNAAIGWLDLPIKSDEVNVPKTISFLELTKEKQANINLRTRGPMSLLLPYAEDRLFIDYCWIPEFLYNLFFGVTPTDQNFKGDALEEIVRQDGSALPTGPCKAVSGEERQIDAAFALDNVLVIAECKAFARSFGVDLGDSRAIGYRNERIQEALKEVDSKARWLASNPRGTNYDITKFKVILPIAITPFVEYLSSLSPFYWLAEHLPRVMTPDELSDAMEKKQFGSISVVHPHAVFVK